MKVVYNGVTLERVFTSSWDEQVQYDESGMNMLGTRAVMVFEGSVTSASLAGDQNPVQSSVDSASDGSSLPQNVAFSYKLNNILRLLEIPRQALEVTDDANPRLPIFVAYPAESLSDSTDENAKRNMDVNGGPKPLGVKILYQVRDYARIAFSIEVTKIRCLGGETGEELGEDPTEGFVVSNRCWTDEVIDEAFYTTRTFTGRLRISSPLKSVHFYRDIYYPQLEIGFYRQSVRFSESEDGLTLNYSVVDKQRRTAAPYPCTRIEGSAKYTLVNMAQASYDVEVTGIGAPYAPKQAIVTRVLELLGSKIREMIDSANVDGTIPHFEIYENFGDPPAITARARFLMVSGKADNAVDVNSNKLFKTTGVGISVIGRPISFEPWDVDGETIVYQRYLSQTPNAFGYQVYSVYDSETSAAEGSESPLQDSGFFGYIKCMATVPCVSKPLKYQSGIPTKSDIEEDEIKTVVQHDGKGATYGEEKSGAVEAAIEFPWTFYKSHIIYDTNNMTVALPSAMGVAEGSGSPVVVKLAGSIPKARVVIEAERKNALPTFPSPYDAVTVMPDTLEIDNLTFTPLNSSIQYNEPQRGTIGEDVVFSGKCEIEYAMSREFGPFDEVWLLGNPTFQNNCLYPVKADGTTDPSSFLTAFDGKQLSRDWDNNEQGSSDANDANNQQLGESNE